MTAQADDAAAFAADALAYVCDHLTEIRSESNDDPPSMAALDAVEAAARSGHDLEGALRALHVARQAAGDALGIYGHTRGTLRVSGIDRVTAAEIVYLCPTRRCARYRWPDAAGVPACTITAEPLRRERL